MLSILTTHLPESSMPAAGAGWPCWRGRRANATLQCRQLQSV